MSRHHSSPRRARLENDGTRSLWTSGGFTYKLFRARHEFSALEWVGVLVLLGFFLAAAAMPVLVGSVDSLFLIAMAAGLALFVRLLWALVRRLRKSRN